jgi:hypothetical protein
MIADVDSTCDQLCALGCFFSWKRRDDRDGKRIPDFGIRDLSLLERASYAGGEGESFRNGRIEGLSERC